MADHWNLRVDHLDGGYPGRKVLHDICLDVPAGKVAVILGANGCGKSTLLKMLARLLRPASGRVLLDERPLSSIGEKELARIIGLLSQSPEAPDGIRVADLVSRGRFPHRRFLQGMGEEDRKAVEEALRRVHVEDLADRRVDELSGGQRQRVWIAMVLAQQTDILLLDEPTTYLDIAHQIEILDIVRDLNEEYGTTVVMVLHDINLAARYAHHIIGMAKGRLVQAGTPEEVITPERMKELYDLDCIVMEDPETGTPLVVPKKHQSR